MAQWYEVLRDTLIAFELPAWSRTVRRKAVETAKFYFFDTGVVRALRRLPPVSEASADFGAFFEHYVFLELRQDQCMSGYKISPKSIVNQIRNNLLDRYESVIRS